MWASISAGSSTRGTRLAFKLIRAIAARQKTNTERPRALCRQHVPDAVTHHAGRLDLDTQASPRRPETGRDRASHRPRDRA